MDAMSYRADLEKRNSDVIRIITNQQNLCSLQREWMNVIYNLCEIGLDEETLRSYRMREMAEFDYNSGMKKAKDEGRTEGKAEGRDERNFEIARNMKVDREPVEKIMRYTGLTAKAIEDL